MKKMSRKSKIIRRIRAVILTIPIMFVSGVIIAFNKQAGFIMSLLAVVALLLYAVLYVSLLYKAFCYEYNESQLTIKRGVLFKIKTEAEYDKIQYCEISSTTLQNFFRLSSLKLYLCGSVIILPHLEKKDATCLANIIHRFKDREDDISQP